MEMKQRRLIIVTVVALAGLLAVWSLPTTGRAETDELPHSMKQMVEEIYETVVYDVPQPSQREGYCQSFSQINKTQTIFTVPDDERFVLLKLYCYSKQLWSLTVNDNLFIDGRINDFQLVRGPGKLEHWERYMHDFPDGCVIIKAGETLKVVPYHGSILDSITLIGYFEEAAPAI